MNRTLFIAALILLPAALLIHLGAMVFIDDEAIRALVAQEMIWSGNYVSPTMHGDVYLNKPPLFNWILAISFSLFGGAGEFATRFPTVLSVLGFAATTYYFSRKHFSRSLAGLHALTVVTCGRMLFWDSMLGLIDVTFSWVVYAQIMLLYEYGSKGQWWRAFAWSYGLTAVGFMLKGLPAIVFQGVTIFALLTWVKAWKQFIRPAHLLSGVACVALLSLYYWQYSQYVDLSLVVDRLFLESGKRTAAAHSIWENVAHVAGFPFEMSYHFLPWTLLLAYLLQRGSWARLKTNNFAAFCLVAFLANLPIYWLSPNVYPRYLLMLFPLLFGSCLYLHTQHLRQRTLTYRSLRYLLLGTMSVIAIALPFVPLVPETAIVSYAWLKSILLGAAAGAVVWTGWKRQRGYLLHVAVFLLIARVAFNFFVLPPRAAGDERGIAVRKTAVAAMETTKEDQVAIYGYSLIEPATGYYLTQARGAIIPRIWEGFDDKTLYLTSPWQYPDIKVEAVDSVYLRHHRSSYPIGPFAIPPTDRARMGLGGMMDGMGTLKPGDE
ncbi:glycosyltransferase family 39 protein [Lewinella sp. 4G2]|uniref:ArnT family glycosyltransferase n=1 Tax=Lewinella sp. 4G2 TaxID=1803372 RepID=UPI0007B4D6F6|nr:glycosyltransferase family 39 protein [Lewinella sp. 4G2]OAV43032.1 hypothetical protein A3850_000295 [Lewinella sp. 4G2]